VRASFCAAIPAGSGLAVGSGVADCAQATGAKASDANSAASSMRLMSSPSSCFGYPSPRSRHLGPATGAASTCARARSVDLQPDRAHYITPRLDLALHVIPQLRPRHVAVFRRARREALLHPRLRERLRPPGVQPPDGLP